MVTRIDLFRTTAFNMSNYYNSTHTIAAEWVSKNIRLFKKNTGKLIKGCL